MYVDFDLAADIDTRRSTTSLIAMLGGVGVIWMSALQKCVALSST